jgi:hypothetical protein
MTEKKNYNALALRGADVDDMDYVEQFGLDPELAYTPKINDAMLDKVYEDNLNFYRAQGMPEKDAIGKASDNRAIAKVGINKLMRQAKA